MTIRVAVSGTGKMGLDIIQAISHEPDLELVGVLSRSAKADYFSGPGVGGTVPLDSDPAMHFRRARPDVVVDFTNAEWTPRCTSAALAAGVRPVIGTSGLADSFLAELSKECADRQIGAVFAPNFAIGAVVMIHLAKLAGLHFEQAEIIEMHHDQKVDAPSATAIATARAMARHRGRPFKRAEVQKESLKGAREASLEGITIHSVRLAGLVAHQEVLLGAPGQTLTIRHDSLSRESFRPGVLMAIREVPNRRELVLGLDKLLGLE